MDLLESLKKRYLNAPLEGRVLLRDNLYALASSYGKLDEIVKWLKDVDAGIIKTTQEERGEQTEERVKDEGEEERVEEEKEERVEIPERPIEREEPVRTEEKPESVDINLKLQKMEEGVTKIINRLDEISKRIQEHDHILDEHRRILERYLEKNEEEVDEITPQEFGVKFSSKNLNKTDKIYSKIRRNAMENNVEKEISPTERRKKRLASLQKTAQEEPKTLKEFYDIEKGVEEWKKLPIIPEPPYTTEEQLQKRKEREMEQLKQRVWDISRLAAELSDDESKWIVSYEGKPLLEVVKGEDTVEDEFISRDYGKDILRTLALKGLGELENKYKINLLDTTIKEEEKVTAKGEKNEEEKNEEEKDKKKEEAAYEIKFERGWRLANLVMQKNLTDSPLKGVLFEILQKKAGIKNPAPFIEEAFRLSNEKHFETLLALTKKYIAMDDKTLAEVEEFVKNAKTQIANLDYDEKEEITRELEAEELKRRVIAGSVPILSNRFEKEDPLKKAIPKPLNWYTLNKE